jgi:hypothetical protein
MPQMLIQDKEIVFKYCFFAFKMFKMIERPADCKILSLIRFLNARNVKPADIHRQICEVYGENAVSDGMVRKWVGNFNEGRDNLHDEPRSGRLSVVTGGHVRRGGGYRNCCPVMINFLIMMEAR